MLKQTTFEQFQQLAQQGKAFAIHSTVPADNLTPISAYQSLGGRAKGATLLESTPETGQQARYSFIGIDPVAEFNSSDNNALQGLREFHQQQHCLNCEEQPGFIGGIVGLLTYDAARHFEKFEDRHAAQQQIPDFVFSSYQFAVCFDHLNNTVTLSQRIEDSDSNENNFKQATNALNELNQAMRQATQKKVIRTQDNSPMQADLSDEEFGKLVEKAKQYIANGDIFQVVLSREFSKPLQASPFEVYRALRMVSPAPYLFYLDKGDYVITGASPEKLVSVEGKQIATNPLAGTKVQTTDLTERKQREADLLADEKEMAEHVMLVDLGRNDLGKISQLGSVAVKEFAQIKHYSHVMHIASEVTGQLAENKDAFDALTATFPAGTLSGAPKIRAMQIIDELESSRRGTYGGVICFVDSQGDLNSCITIRSAFIKDGIVSVRAGAGIVYDSDPQKEADETRHKASTVLNAIEFAEGALA